MNALLRGLVSLAAGALFGFGLSLSGMVDPARVIGFLDIGSGHWDPSLAFVLGGALLIALPGVAIQRRLPRPALDDHFHLPTSTAIDRQLMLGSAIFGAGWGLAGFCPGPAVATLSIGLLPSFIFAGAMVAGMMLHDRAMAGRIRP